MVFCLPGGVGGGGGGGGEVGRIRLTYEDDGDFGSHGCGQGIWRRLSGRLEGLVVADEYLEGSWTKQSTDRAVGKLRGVDLIFIPELSCILALPINQAAPPLLQHPFGQVLGSATGSEERCFSTFLRQS